MHDGIRAALLEMQVVAEIARPRRVVFTLQQVTQIKHVLAAAGGRRAEIADRVDRRISLCALITQMPDEYVGTKAAGQVVMAGAAVDLVVVGTGWPTPTGTL